QLEEHTPSFDRELYSFAPINYISGGLLGDHIHQLSVIREKFYQTGRKGNLYISNIGDPFRFGVERAYKDTYELISQQKYINKYEIYNNQFGIPQKEHSSYINLCTWRKNKDVVKVNIHYVYKLEYGVEWGSKVWLTLPKDEK